MKLTITTPTAYKEIEQWEGEATTDYVQRCHNAIVELSEVDQDQVEQPVVEIEPNTLVAIYTLLLNDALGKCVDAGSYELHMKALTNRMLKQLEKQVEHIYKCLSGDSIDDDFLIKLTNIFEAGIVAKLQAAKECDFS